MKPQVKKALAKLAIFIGAIYCLIPGSIAAIALLAGLAIALALGNPLQASTKNYSAKLLAYSVAGLGAGINLMLLGKLGLASLGVTALTIFLTLVLGQLIARVLKAEPDTSILISVGTAICGGSAIAAASSALKTKSEATTVALGTVFILNALALFIFPPIGHFFDLSQFQFGLWSAIAIHDTSSVVGASLQYGAEALQVGTTVKLARALWIVPVTLALAYWFKKTESPDAVKKPWFILGFLLFAIFFTFFPQMAEYGKWIEFLAKKGLILALFFIGTNMTVETLKSVGARSFAQGLILWLVITTSSLFLVRFF